MFRECNFGSFYFMRSRCSLGSTYTRDWMAIRNTVVCCVHCVHAFEGILKLFVIEMFNTSMIYPNVVVLIVN